MESLELLKKETVSPKEWLTYYRNVWTRNAVARTIDVKCDTLAKEKNPEEEVMEYDMETGRPTGRVIKIGERLETRKMLVEDALKIVKGVDVLLADENFEESNWSEKALAVAEDMIKKEESAPAPETPAEEPKAEVTEEKTAEEPTPTPEQPSAEAAV